MTLPALLADHARAAGRGRAARVAARLVLVGGTAIALCIFLARTGIDVPFLRLPGMPATGSAADRVFGFLAVSFAGLLQGAAWLALVFLLALAVRVGGAALLRPAPAHVARELDRALETDRYSAAWEAKGRLAPLVEQAATALPPRTDLLARQRPRWRDRWLRRFVIALVLVVAMAPGTAPGEDGESVAGAPDGGRTDEPLALVLVGEKQIYGTGEAVPVQVLAEASAAPVTDLELPVRIVLDDGPEIRTDARLFLAAGAPGQDAVTLDLRALAGKLDAGEHEAVALAGDLESNVYRFKIDDPGGEAGREPQPRPDPPPSQGPQQGGPRKVKPKFIKPLVREGETVEKKAKVPIEVPGGGAPAERTLDEAWPELERRKEAALNRPGLSPAARKLVREYFDRLKPEKK